MSKRLRLRAGVDLVYVPRLVELLENKAFVRRVFQPAELQDAEPQHLAAVLAAKEACFKALDRPPNWQAVTVTGAGSHPRLVLSTELVPDGLLSADLSLSHERDYAIALVVLLINEDS